MLIGLTGYAGSGKDTAAAYLVQRYGFERRAFADKLRELVYAQNPLVPPDSGHDYLRPLVDDIGWDAAKRGVPAVRRLLQEAGAAHREVFGEDFWVDRVLPASGPDMLTVRENIVVTDVRYPNEARRVRNLGGVMVRIERPDVGPVNSHASEQLLNLADGRYVRVVNDCSIPELHKRLNQVIHLIGELSQ